MKRIICAVIVIVIMASLPLTINAAQTEATVRMDVEIELSERRGSANQQYISFDISDRGQTYSTYDLSSVLNLGKTKEYGYWWTREAVTKGQRFSNTMYYYFDVLALESGSFVFQVNIPTMYGAQGSHAVTLQVKDRYDEWVDYTSVGGALTVTYTRTDFTYSWQGDYDATAVEYTLYQYAIAGSFDSTSDYTEFRFVCPFFLYYPANWTEFPTGNIEELTYYQATSIYKTYNKFILPYDDGAMTYYYDMTEASAKAGEITARNSEAIKNNTGVIASNSGAIVNNTEKIVEVLGEVDPVIVEKVYNIVDVAETDLEAVESMEEGLISDADSVMDDIGDYTMPTEFDDFVANDWAALTSKLYSIPMLSIMLGLVIVCAIVCYILVGRKK